MALYSHSKLETFKQCKLKFKYKYIDKIKIVESSIEAFLGSLVHDTLEWLYNQVKENKLPTIDDIVTHYSVNWKEKHDPKIYLITRKEMTVKDYFNKGISFLLDYYIKHQPFDDNTLETEKRVIIELGKHKLIGFIDRLVHNKEKDIYEIHDYKTANNLPSKEKVESDKQLALYSIAVKNEFGEEKEIHLIWHYLAYNKIISSKRTSRQLEELKKEIINIIEEIESIQEFPANISKLCDWCEYKNMCPDFQKSKLVDGASEFREERDFRKEPINQNSEKQISLDDFPTIKKYIREE